MPAHKNDSITFLYIQSRMSQNSVQSPSMSKPMQYQPRSPVGHITCAVFVSLSLLVFSTQSFAWGRDGHTAVGVLAVNQLQPEAIQVLENVVNPLTKQAMAEACNWPDVYREAEEGEWSMPLHFINIPRGDERYTESRDCPEQAHASGHPAQYCATEAIKFYAAELAKPEASAEQRWRSFAWLCHLVGDLHQPLHAGFADDRGGNDVQVSFGDWHMNLHRFWDSSLINEQAGSWQYLVGQLSEFPPVLAGSDWSPSMVNGWTNRSHKLATEMAYPATANIDEVFAQQSWELIQEQIRLAASHLALIINSVLKPESGKATGSID